MELKTFFAQDLLGNVIPSPTAYLYLPGTTTLATGLQNETGGALTNPWTGNVNGKVTVAAPDGDYDLRVTGAGRDSTMRVRFLGVENSQEAQLADYAALRAYNGGAVRAYITGALGAAKPAGIAGTFQVDASDTTSADNGGTIIVGGDGRRWKRDYVGEPTVDWWGCETSQSLSGADSAQDSYLGFRALVDWCESMNYSGVVKIGSGYHRISQPLDCEISIVFEGFGPSESYIHCDHMSGPGIRFRRGNSGIRKMGVTASASRRSGAYGAGSNFGILFEGDDVPENSIGAPRLLHCVMEDFYIFGHPQGLLHIVGPAFTGVINCPNLNSTKGHGITFDRGESTGRINIITGLISGICKIGEGRISNCAGHAIAAGSPTSNFSTPALRVVIDNIEGAGNATDAAVRYYNSPVYLRGANFVYENSGLSVQDGGVAAVVAGRNIHLRNNRILGGYEHAYLILSYDELPTNGVYIDGISVINSNQPLNPAVLVSLPAGESVRPGGIHIRQGEMDWIAKIIQADGTIGTSIGDIPNLTVNGARPPVLKNQDTVVTNSDVLINDPELKMWITGTEYVHFKATIEYQGSASADIKFSIYGPPSSALVRYGPLSSIKVGTADAFTVQSPTNGGNITAGSAAVGLSRTVIIEGVCKAGGNGGYIGVRFAQLVAENTDTKIVAGLSMLEIKSIY
jgi:hypothetical protein